MVDMKEKLIKKIQEVNDPKTIEEVCRLLEMDFDDYQTYQFNPNQISILNVAQEQISQGKFVSHEKANQEIEEWLNSIKL